MSFLTISHKIIKDCIVGTAIITAVVMFMAAAVIAIYKAFGYENTQPLFKTTEIAESYGYKNEIGNRDKGDKIFNSENLVFYILLL